MRLTGLYYITNLATLSYKFGSLFDVKGEGGALKRKGGGGDGGGGQTQDTMSWSQIQNRFSVTW